MANQGGDGGNPMEPQHLEKAMGWGDGLMEKRPSRGNVEKSRLSGFKRHKIEWTQFLEPYFNILKY